MDLSRRRGVFYFWAWPPGALGIFLCFLKILSFPFDALGAFFIPLPFFKILLFPFDALRPRRAPTFWPAESRQRLAKEGCAPFGIPPAGGRARVACGHNRARGVTELLAASRQELPRRFAEALPAKAVSDAVPCADAHDRQTFPFGERRGQGGASPQQARMTGRRPPTGNLGGQGGAAPKRSGGGAAAEASAHALAAFPNGTEAPAAQAARSSAKFAAPARTWGFPKGGV